MSRFSASVPALWYPVGSGLSFDLWRWAGLLLLQPTVTNKMLLSKVEMGLPSPLFPSLFDHSGPMGLLVG